MPATIHTLTFGATQKQVQDILDAGYHFDARGEARTERTEQPATHRLWTLIHELHAGNHDDGPHAA